MQGGVTSNKDFGFLLDLIYCKAKMFLVHFKILYTLFGTFGAVLGQGWGLNIVWIYDNLAKSIFDITLLLFMYQLCMFFFSGLIWLLYTNGKDDGLRSRTFTM